MNRLPELAQGTNVETLLDELRTADTAVAARLLVRIKKQLESKPARDRIVLGEVAVATLKARPDCFQIIRQAEQVAGVSLFDKSG